MLLKLNLDVISKENLMKTNSLDTVRINSTFYILQEIGGYVLLGVFGVLAFLFLPGIHGSKPYFSRYDLPIFVEILSYVFTLIVLSLGIFFFSANDFYIRGDIHFLNDKISYNNKDFLISSLIGLSVALDPLKYKPRNDRIIFNGGGNNWIKYRYGGKRYSVEFLLKSKDDEDLFMKIVKDWSNIQKDIKIGVSTENQLLSLFDNESNYKVNK